MAEQEDAGKVAVRDISNYEEVEVADDEEDENLLEEEVTPMSTTVENLPEIIYLPVGSSGVQMVTSQDRKIHHNELERNRRDHIKESFDILRESIPELYGVRNCSRTLILKRATEYIELMRQKNAIQEQNVNNLKRQNQRLEREIAALEKIRLLECGRTADTDEVAIGTFTPNSSQEDGEDVEADAAEHSDVGDTVVVKRQRIM